jgi:hypothetical protein
MELPVHVPIALLGQLGLFAAFALVIFLLAREAARVVVQVLLIVGIAIAVALYAGWLNQTTVARLLEQIGDGMIVGIKAVVGWITRAWSEISAKG